MFFEGMLSFLAEHKDAGPLASALALFMGATAALLTLAMFHLRALSVTRQARDDALLKILGDLYDRFWDTDDIHPIRRIIDSDKQYAAVGPVLQRINARPVTEHLSDKEALMIDAADKFCAIMLQAYFLRNAESDPRRRNLIDAMFLGHWMSAFMKRPDCALYVEQHWPALWDYYKASP